MMNIQNCVQVKKWVRLRVDNRKERRQKYLLCLILKTYKWKLNPNAKMRFSTFCKLLLKLVINVNVSGMHQISSEC